VGSYSRGEAYLEVESYSGIYGIRHSQYNLNSRIDYVISAHSAVVLRL